jgi:acetyl esterase
VVAVSVHPQAQQLLDGRAAAGAPPLWEQTPDEARAWADATTTVIPAGPALESVRNVVIPTQAGGLPARVYSPSAAAPGLVLYYHGGGWVVGGLENGDSTARALAVASGCDVLSVAYRLAPEHAFPAAADDAYGALAWAASESGLADGRPVIVAGDAAGGNLAAVTALRARYTGGPAIALQVLVYPAVDCDFDRRSYRECEGDELMLNRRDVEWFWDRYAPDPATRLNPYASPLRAPDLSGLPPTYLVTAEFDPLRDEGFAYADRLRAARVPVEHRHYGSQIHGFFAFVGLLDDADKALAETAAAIRAAVRPAPAPRMPADDF